jgi:hypothetical protein
MVLLIGESSNFSFHCVADTRAAARKAMEQGWKKHKRQTAATGTLDDTVALNYIEDMKPGTVYRDYEAL